MDNGLELPRSGIDLERVRQALSTSATLFPQIDAVAETGSTNADLAAAARAGASGRVLIADHQTAGRGRRDRKWGAAPGTSLAISVLWHPQRSDHWSFLPLVTGVAVCDAARAFGVAAVLKWPNDVVVPAADGSVRKLAGLLAERVETPHGPACLIGVGLNTTATATDLGLETATSLALATQSSGQTAVIQPTTVVIEVLSRLERLLAWWGAGTQDDLLADQYLNRCHTIGQRVRVELATGALVGEAEGIDDDGALQVRAHGRIHTVVAGDVVHLR